MIKRIRISGNTDAITGKATLQLKVPGTFSGLDPKQPTFNGRLVIDGTIWCKTPSADDCVTNISGQDLDGVIPSQARAAFPNYPILNVWSDAALDASNQGVYLEPNKTTLVPPKQQFIPSGIYIVLEVQKGVIGVDTVYVNLDWDDLT